MKTIWGETDSIDILAPGILWVTTPSHGGIVLDAKRAARMRLFSADPSAGDFRYWEEDCDWAFPFVVFVEEFDDTEINRSLLAIARATIEHMKPGFGLRAGPGRNFYAAESEWFGDHDSGL